MEEKELHNPTEVASPQPVIPPAPKRSKLPSRAFLVVGIVILTIVACGAYLLGARKVSQVQQPTLTKQSIKPQISKSDNDFFFFSIPQPLEKLTVYDLPSDGAPKSVIKIGDKLWFTGSGSVIEYDTKKEAIVSYSNPKKANCRGSMAYIGGFLYASCAIDNVEDAFDRPATLRTTTLFTGHSGVLKINPENHKLEYTFSKESGLLNGYNHSLIVDDDEIWVPTFNGVGRIHTNTSKVDFYTSELGFTKTSNARKFSINPVIVDRDHVWAWNIASAESAGGIALFTKSTGTWEAFGPRELKEVDLNRIDLEYSPKGIAAKLIPGGVQIAFRDGEINGTYDRLVEKQYSYESGKWTKVNIDRIATGPESEQTNKYLEATYPPSITESVIEDGSGLAQIQIPNSPQIYQLNGRDNFSLSPVIDGKRYILTSSTVDVVDEKAPFRRILVKLGHKLNSSFISTDLEGYKGLIYFLTDSKLQLALVIDTACGGMGCNNEQEAWLVDLKEEKLLRKYSATTGNLPNGELLNDLTMTSDIDSLIIKGKDNKTIFTINTTTYELTPI